MEKKPIVKVVSGIFLWQRRIFLCLEWSESAKGDFWFTPGGKVEDGEDELVALKRELKEELGLGASTLEKLKFRRYYIQRVVWGDRIIDSTNFLIGVKRKPAFSLSVGQKDSGWFSVPPAVALPDQTDVLFLRLGLDGLIDRS